MEDFIAGRYETSLDGSVAESKIGKTVMTADSASGNMWYGMYAKQRKITAIVKTTMIFGCSFDQVMKFVNGKRDGHGYVYYVTIVEAARHSVNRGVSGNNTRDRVANIYDLEGSLLEWTAEASNGYRTFRRRFLQ